MADRHEVTYNSAQHIVDRLSPKLYELQSSMSCKAELDSGHIALDT